MANYLELSSMVLNNQILKRELDSMTGGNVLNLVTDDWESRLENDPTYTRAFSSSTPSSSTTTTTTTTAFTTNAFNNREQDKRLNFNVILVGQCKIIKQCGIDSKPSLIVKNSEPLNKIFRAMCSIQNVSIVSNDFQFYFNQCNILGCFECNNSLKMFQTSGYRPFSEGEVYEHQPCITDTRVFDGRNVINRFLSQMEFIFPENFAAVVHLNVNVRYNITNAVNIPKTYHVGDILDIVGFHENKLRSAKTVNLGSLAQFTQTRDDSNNSQDAGNSSNSHGFHNGSRSDYSHDNYWDSGYDEDENDEDDELSIEDVIEIIQRLPVVKCDEIFKDKNEECIICRENYLLGEEVSFLPCSHAYHSNCIKNWLGNQNKCPMCRLVVE